MIDFFVILTLVFKNTFVICYVLFLSWIIFVFRALASLQKDDGVNAIVYVIDWFIEIVHPPDDMIVAYFRVHIDVQVRIDFIVSICLDFWSFEFNWMLCSIQITQILKVNIAQKFSWIKKNRNQDWYFNSSFILLWKNKNSVFHLL